MVRSWFVGFLVLLLVDAIVVAAIFIEFYPETLMILLQISPFVAAVISAYLAPKNKVMLSVSLAIPTAVLGLLVTIAFQLLGHRVDFPGFKGGLSLLLVSLVYASVLCLLGGFTGRFIAKKMAK